MSILHLLPIVHAKDPLSCESAIHSPLLPATDPYASSRICCTLSIANLSIAILSSIYSINFSFRNGAFIFALLTICFIATAVSQPKMALAVFIFS